MKRRTITMAVGLTAAVLASPAALAQQVTIRWGDVVGGTHPSVQMIDRIAADVKAEVGRPHRDPVVSRAASSAARAT